jgi:hypothetical protein
VCIVKLKHAASPSVSEHEVVCSSQNLETERGRHEGRGDERLRKGGGNEEKKKKGKEKEQEDEKEDEKKKKKEKIRKISE